MLKVDRMGWIKILIREEGFIIVKLFKTIPTKNKCTEM